MKRIELGSYGFEFYPLIKFLDEKKIIICSDRIRVYQFTDYTDDVILSRCLYDKKEVPRGTKGIQYKIGTTIMTLPCGAPIPPGAICTCDCVRVGRPVTYHEETYYYTVSYWYPN